MNILFPLRLAWRQLTYERGKLMAAILGVTFACVLVFMQLGFRDSLYASMANMPNRMQGDLFIQHKQTEALWRSTPFARTEMLRAYALAEVAEVIPIYVGMAQWRNPENFKKRTLMVYGIAPDDHLFQIDGIEQFTSALQDKDNVIFDRLSRPEFGDIARLLQSGRVQIEVNDYKINVAGVYAVGTSFGADGNVIANPENFMRMFQNRNLDQIDMGVVRLKPGSDVIAARDKLAALLNENVYVMDKPEMVSHELNYWKTMAPIGFIFGFGVIMGLVVGMVIVYQILYTDITNHLNEFATLKAMGYKHSYLVRVVMGSSLILALLGFVPGFGLSVYLYNLAEQETFINFPMPLEKIITVFAMTFIMCFLSGVLAMRKMKSANPAEMF